MPSLMSYFELAQREQAPTTKRSTIQINARKLTAQCPNPFNRLYDGHLAYPLPGKKMN